MLPLQCPMNQKNQNRSSSHGRKLGPTHSRPQKPSLHRRGQSYNHALGQSQNAASSPRPTLGGPRRTVTEVINQGDDVETDMASFLQFCATCEKQIVTPGTSILYCSEACRRRDISLPTPPLHTPHTPRSSYFDTALDIVPQRSPTVPRPPSLAFSDLTLSDHGSPKQYPYPHTDRSDSEAARYLEQFLPSGNGSEISANRRPRPNRSSTVIESRLPSLTHTPSSSLGTAASWSSYRPLPRRHDPSTGHFPTRSVDLVIPTFPPIAPLRPDQLITDSSLKSSASTMTSFRVAEAENASFDRRRASWRDVDQTSSSLKRLLSQEAGKVSSNDE